MTVSYMITADETFHTMNSELRELPAVELSTLPIILKVLMSDPVLYIAFYLGSFLLLAVIFGLFSFQKHWICLLIMLFVP